jgi:preprotein translocase subunit SecB
MAEASNTPQNLPFAIQVQYVKDFSFENPNPLAVFTDESNAEPAINIDIQVKATPVSDALYEVVLDVTANAKKGDNVMYVAELSYGAVVSLESDLPQELIGQIVMVYVPNMMFPFVRSIIADITREGGYIPLLLAPVDFMALYQNQATTTN